MHNPATRHEYTMPQSDYNNCMQTNLQHMERSRRLSSVATDRRNSLIGRVSQMNSALPGGRASCVGAYDHHEVVTSMACCSVPYRSATAPKLDLMVVDLQETGKCTAAASYQHAGMIAEHGHAAQSTQPHLAAHLHPSARYHRKNSLVETGVGRG